MSGSIKGLTDWLVDNVEYILFRLAPLSATLLSGLAVVNAFGPFISSAWVIPITVAIESVGLTVGLVNQRVDSFNRNHPLELQLDDTIPRRALWLYAAVVFLIILGGETIPTIAGGSTVAEIVRSFVPLIFPLFTISGSLILSIEDHIRRVENGEKKEEDSKEQARQREQERILAEAAEEKARLRRIEDEERERQHRIEDEERQRRWQIEDERRHTRLSQPQPKPQPQPQPQSKPSTVDRRNQLRHVLDGVTLAKDVNKAELGRQYGVSATQISKDLVAIGIHLNGH